MNRWLNRVALVTGASSGIGAATCRELVKYGMTVVGCSRNVAKIEAVATEEEVSKSSGKLHAIKCDISSELEILKLHEEIRSRFGRIDVCINNAMSVINSSLVEGKTKDWRYMLELGVLGVWTNTREAIKLMKEKNITDGQIIQMGSIVGHKIPSFQEPPKSTPVSWYHIYNGAKWMNRALAESLRQELKFTGSRIKISTISPGAVETNLLAGSTSKEIAEAFFNYYKVLQPKDVAESVIYILSTPDRVCIHDVIMEPLEFQI